MPYLAVGFILFLIWPITLAPDFQVWHLFLLVPVALFGGAVILGDSYL